MEQKIISSLSPRDAWLLRRSVSRSVREPYGYDGEPQPYVQPAPEAFVAIVPRNGIPGLEIFEEDSTFYYRPGRAECEITLINKDNPLALNSPVRIFPVRTSPLSQNTTKEWVHNPYGQPHYGRMLNDRMRFAFVHRERNGMWMCERPPEVLKAKTVGPISIQTASDVEIWQGGQGIDEYVVAYLNWTDGGVVIPPETEVFIKYFEDEFKWVVVSKPLITKTWWVLMSEMTHNSGVNAERLDLTELEDGWERSGHFNTIYSIILNTADTIEAGTVVSTMPYQGYEVVDSIYCTINDWLDV